MKECNDVGIFREVCIDDVPVDIGNNLIVPVFTHEISAEVKKPITDEVDKTSQSDTRSSESYITIETEVTLIESETTEVAANMEEFDYKTHAAIRVDPLPRAKVVKKEGSFDDKRESPCAKDYESQSDTSSEESSEDEESKVLKKGKFKAMKRIIQAEEREEYLNSIGVWPRKYSKLLLEEKVFCVLFGSSKIISYQLDVVVQMNLEDNHSVFGTMITGLNYIRDQLTNFGYILQLIHDKPLKAVKFPKTPDSMRGDILIAHMLLFTYSFCKQVEEILKTIDSPSNFLGMFGDFLEKIETLKDKADTKFDNVSGATEYDQLLAQVDPFSYSIGKVTEMLSCRESLSNRKKLAGYLRYYTSTSGDDLCSLPEYVERMGEKQKDIYCITVNSRETFAASAFFEVLKKECFEVIYLVEGVHKYAIQPLREFKGKGIINFEFSATDQESIKQ